MSFSQFAKWIDRSGSKLQELALLHSDGAFVLLFLLLVSLLHSFEQGLLVLQGIPRADLVHLGLPGKAWTQ